MIEKLVNLEQHNTLRLKSLAESYLEISDRKHLQFLISQILEKKITADQIRILGGGSNLVLPPILSGLTLRMMLKGIETEKADSDEFQFINVAAGESWDHFVQWTLDRSLYGLENLSLIPGTVGGAPIQNIGAYGVEVKEHISSVRAINLDTGSFETFENSQCQFSYRHSFFKTEIGQKYFIVSVKFKLSKKFNPNTSYKEIKTWVDENPKTISANLLRQKIIDIRNAKLPSPAEIGNVGSFFKNPIISKNQYESFIQKHPAAISYPFESGYKLAAGWLIDQCGWKGRRLGPVGMYEKQALVLVNHGNATLDDVLHLVRQVQKDVDQKFNVSLEPEPLIWR